MNYILIVKPTLHSEDESHLMVMGYPLPYLYIARLKM